MDPLSADQKIHLYREMVRIRSFQHRALRNYMRPGNMGGFLILDIGQESIAVAARSLLGANDHLVCGHRAFGHALASGMTMNECMAELYGKQTGSSHGKGGMFGFFAPRQNFHGGFSVAGAQTPIATGLAFALKHKDLPGSVLCSLGDAATSQGCVHESFNLASLFDLPVVFLIENNQFGMGTSVARHSRFSDCLAKRAEAYGMPWDLIEDGSNLSAVRRGIHAALHRAKTEQRPTVLEIHTYRFHGFTVADAGQFRYRSREEIEFHVTHRDPIKNWFSTLEQEGLLTRGQADAIREEAKAEAIAATEFAQSSPAPTIPDITRDVYSHTDHPGRLFFND